MVALPGGEWSVQMATGRLEQGDGSPLALDGREELLAQQESLMPNVARKLKEPRETARASVAALPPSDQNSLPGRFVEPRNLAFEFQMAQARAILGEALKSAGK
jgi:hypothetical protein